MRRVRFEGLRGAFLVMESFVVVLLLLLLLAAPRPKK